MYIHIVNQECQHYMVPCSINENTMLSESKNGSIKDILDLRNRTPVFIILINILLTIEH